MSIFEFYEELKQDPHLFKQVLGITQNDFKQLHSAFVKNKNGDKTTKLGNIEKVAAMLLIRRFQLNRNETRNILLSNSAISILDNFYLQVEARFDEVVEALPTAIKNRIQAIKTIERSSVLRQTYSTLEELQNAAVNATAAEGLITHKVNTADETWIDAYLKKKVTDKNKTGQQNFLQLFNCMLFDEEQFESHDKYAVWYFALAFELFSHNSSCHIAAGQGKVRSEEENGAKYCRSQKNHHKNLFFKNMTSNDARLQCILPRNQPLQKIILNSDYNDFANKLKNYNADGYVKPGKESVSYFGTKLAHSGLRMNNNKFIRRAIRKYFSKHEGFPRWISKLLQQEIIPQNFPQPIAQCSPYILKTRITNLYAQFKSLGKNLTHQPYLNLQEEITNTRHARIKKIISQCEEEKFTNIKVDRVENSSCIFVNFYPNKNVPDNANYKEGITNVIIGFFGGLLNHRPSLCTQWRQSFGFLRPTITDVGNMRMRISLDASSGDFDPHLVQSLGDLDEILGKYDFTDKTNIDLKKGFEKSEEPGKRKKENVGIRFRTTMRATQKCEGTFACAQSFLNQASGKDNHISLAFKQYINKITSNGYSGNEVSLQPYAAKRFKIMSADKESPPFIKLLHNLFEYSINFVNEIKDEKKQTIFNHGQWHVLTKLYKNCLKAQAILKNYKEMSITQLYNKSLLLIDNLLEYLTLLDGLNLINNHAADPTSDTIKKLVADEKQYVAAKLGLSNTTDMNVYFTDNGQQSFIASLMVMALQVFQGNNLGDLNEKIYIDNSCYYELKEFMHNDLKLSITDSKQKAKIAFMDMTGIKKLTTSASPYTSAEVVIIDITNNPCLTDSTVKDYIHTLFKEKKTVLLVSSLLKHRQLGLDKYQAGEIIALTPPGAKKLDANIKEEFEKISSASIHPLTASFLNMIKEVCQEKAPEPAVKAKVQEPLISNLQPNSLFKPVISQVTTKNKLPVLSRQRAKCN